MFIIKKLKSFISYYFFNKICNRTVIDKDDFYKHFQQV